MKKSNRSRIPGFLFLTPRDAILLEEVERIGCAGITDTIQPIHLLGGKRKTQAIEVLHELFGTIGADHRHDLFRAGQQPGQCNLGVRLVMHPGDIAHCVDDAPTPLGLDFSNLFCEHLLIFQLAGMGNSRIDADA